jgi:DNA processing protein
MAIQQGSATAPALSVETPPTVSAEALQLLDALGHAPATLEILATRTEMGDAALQNTLLQLELAGHVTALPGGRFARSTHG